MVEAGQALAARGGLDPEAELADLDGLGVEVHAVGVVLEDLPVEVEEVRFPRSSSSRALESQMFSPALPSSMARNRPRKLSQTGRGL